MPSLPSAQKIRRDRRRAKGLCACCPEPAAPKRARCERHLADNRDAQRKYYRRLKEAAQPSGTEVPA